MRMATSCNGAVASKHFDHELIYCCTFLEFCQLQTTRRSHELHGQNMSDWGCSRNGGGDQTYQLISEVREFHTALYTTPAFPSNLWTRSPDSVSQMYTYPSSDPLRTTFSPGPKDTRIKFFDVFWCPLYRHSGRPCIALESARMSSRRIVVAATRSTLPIAYPRVGLNYPLMRSEGGPPGR